VLVLDHEAGGGPELLAERRQPADVTEADARPAVSDELDADGHQATLRRASRSAGGR
jgi:hypothetical protein